MGFFFRSKNTRNPACMFAVITAVTMSAIRTSAKRNLPLGWGAMSVTELLSVCLVLHYFRQMGALFAATPDIGVVGGGRPSFNCVATHPS